MQFGLLRGGQRDLGRFDRLVEVVRVAVVEQRVHDLGCGAAQARQDRRDSRVGHEQSHRARGAKLVEQPVGEHIQPEGRSDAGLEEDAIEHLAADGDARQTGDL